MTRNHSFYSLRKKISLAYGTRTTRRKNTSLVTHQERDRETKKETKKERERKKQEGSQN